MEKVIEDQKLRIAYLTKRLEDHLNETLRRSDLTEELQCDVQRQERSIRILKNNVEEKNEELKLFEEKIRTQNEETTWFKERIENLKAETSEFKEKLIEANMTICKLEKEKNSSDYSIKYLQKEIEELKKELKEELFEKENNNDVSNLIKEIESLKRINEEKENMVKELEKDKEIAQSKLEEVKKENSDILEEMNFNEKGFESLGEELGIIDPRSHNVSPASEECDKNFPFKPHIEVHKKDLHIKLLDKKVWKMKEMQMEKEISAQHLKLSSDLLHLQQTEQSDRNLCRCRSFCRIFHQKHNWTKPVSLEMVRKYRNLQSSFSCNICDKTFVNVDMLNFHIKTSHKKPEGEKSKVGKSM